MATLWNPSDREALKARLSRLSPEATPHWGSLDAPRMLAHVADALRMAAGELGTEMPWAPTRLPGLKHLFIYFLPFPKGVRTATELLARAAESFAAERDETCRLIDAFGALDRNRDWPTHPAFGRLSARAWGVLMARHLDHHLRQFGV